MKARLKPALRWLSQGYGGGLRLGLETGNGGSTRRWKALWIGEARFIDVKRVEAVLAFRERSGNWAKWGAIGASEARRMQLVAWSKTPREGDIVGTIFELRDHRMAEGCTRRPKLEGGVNRISTGAGFPKGHTAPRTIQGLSSSISNAVIVRESGELGIERCCGCACVVTVAEAGRRIFLFSPASREASRRREVTGKEIAQRGGSALTRRAGCEG